MLPDGRRIGPHLPLGHGMAHAADRAALIGADTLQVFTDNPTAWRRRSSAPSELPAFRARLAEHDLRPLAVHAAYLVNLAGSDPVLLERSIEMLAHELTVAATFGARFVNVHIGSHRGDGPSVGTERVAAAVDRALQAVEATAPAAATPIAPTSAPTSAPASVIGPGAALAGRDAADAGEAAHPVDPLPVDPLPVLVLENSAGSGGGLGVDVPELARIAEALDRRGAPLERIGFCLDTAHAWGAGVPLGTPEGVDSFLVEFDRAIGLERLRLVHLNDSRAERGSRADRHEHLGAGRIGVEGLRAILTHPGLRHATYVLETPGMEDGFDAINLARAAAIARGEPLEPLPPGAGHVRRGRSVSTAGPRDDEGSPGVGPTAGVVAATRGSRSSSDG